MAVAFEEEMNALKLVSGPDGKPQLVHEPYLQVSCSVRYCHTHATRWLKLSGWGKGGKGALLGGLENQEGLAPGGLGIKGRAGWCNIEVWGAGMEGALGRANCLNKQESRLPHQAAYTHGHPKAKKTLLLFWQVSSSLCQRCN